MNSAPPNSSIESNPLVGVKTAFQALKVIANKHAGRLVITFSLIAVENSLLLAYPLLAGFAIDAIVRGDGMASLLYVVVVLGLWGIGALRRAVDTRTFTRIYAEMAVNVVMDQRERSIKSSVTAARVVLAREFVDFFETHLPTIFTALVSIMGSVGMLLIVEPLTGIWCLVALIAIGLCIPRFAGVNQSLHQNINNRLEKEIELVGSVRVDGLRRHYQMLSNFRVKLSDRESVAFLVVGILAARLFTLTILNLSKGGEINAGHIYSVMTYLWIFVSSLDEAPSVVDQIAKLKDIGKRVRL